MGRRRSQGEGRAVQRYGAAVVVAVVALLLRLFLVPIPGEQSPFLLFWMAIVLASLYGGFGPGVIATALTAIFAAYFLLPPTYSVMVADQRSRVAVALFVLQGLMLSVLTSSLRAARARAEADLTARKAAESAVHLQAQLLDTVEQAVVATDHTGSVIYWNRFAEQLYGWPAAEAVGRQILDITPAATTREQAEEILDRLRCGDSWSGEFEVQRRDGTTFPAFVTDAPVRDVEGNVVAIVGVSLDISDRKRAEEASRFLARASAVLSSSLDDQEILELLSRLAVPYIADWCAVDMIDRDGSFRRLAVAHVDPEKVELAWEVERRYGFDPNLPEGAARVLRSGRSAIYPEVTDDLLAHVATDAEHLHLMQTVGLRSGMIVPLVARDRTLGAISFGAAESGRRFGAADLELAEDLARRAALAIDNARLYGEAQAAIRLREEFLSVAAHELKTPVTSLLAYAQILQRRTATNPVLDQRNQRALAVIEAQAERLSRLISLLLEVSRLAAGHFYVNLAPLDLRDLLCRITQELQAILDTHVLELVLPDDPVMIEGDALRLEQMLQNLIQNAVKYSPRGTTISVTLGRDAENVVIGVADRGIGIPAAAMPQLFQRFFRAADHAQPGTAGLGIGLYIVHEIVARHGGTIDVASEEGVGTTFSIRLPLLRPEVRDGLPASGAELPNHPVAP